ncbi:MAG: hypothetical protein IJP16_04680 [Clostridia bacterium]|nr:hypothetical protein [Clostridia bacterium]
MRTIVINTTNEISDTGLDFLFKAPFDSSAFLWYDCKLSEMGECAEDIKKSLITTTDIVDKDYNLIVLIDLYFLPYGKACNMISLYQRLLVKYISDVFVSDYCFLNGMVPQNISVAFLDSSSNSFNIEFYQKKSNAVEQAREEREKILSKEKKTRIKTDKNGMLVDLPDTDDDSVSVYSPEDKAIMLLFGWSEGIDSKSINWRLKLSNGEELDFSKVFSAISHGISHSFEGAKILRTLLRDINDALPSFSDGDFEGTMIYELSLPSDINKTVNVLSYRFPRENERQLVEGYFTIYANVFSCIGDGTVLRSVKPFNDGDIEMLLKRARAKYKHYSEDENIELETEDVRLIVEGREKLKKMFVDDAEELYGLKSVDGRDTCDKIRNKVASILGIKGDGKDKSIGVDFTAFKTAFDSKNHKGNAAALIEDYRYKIDNDRESGGREGLQDKHLRKQRLSSSLDKGFKALVEAIYENYDADRIKAQNKKLIDNCYRSFWDSRDKQSHRTLIEYINGLKPADNSGNHEEQVKQELDDVKNGDLHFYRADKADDYNKLVEEITDVEHKICKNRDVLLETRSLALRYDDIKRRGRLGTLAVVGGLIAIATAILPYILIQGQSINSNIVHLVLYLLFTAGFAALYLIASIIFLNGIIKKKRALMSEAADLFAQSVWDRWESAVAFYTFYAKTTVEAEAHKLIWSEVEERVEKNRRYCAERNNHKIRLGHMIGLVDRFITRLKYSTDDGAESYSFEGCDKLKGHEAYYTEHNRRIYSILDKDFCSDCCKTDNNNGEEDE